VRSQRSTNGRKLDVSLPFLVLDFGLDIVNGVGGFNFEGDGFTRKATEAVRTEEKNVSGKGNERFNEDLHVCALYLSNETNGGIVDESVE
jgi:hypothetical protein